MRIGILDRYIIGKFLGTFFFILAVIMAISVIFDLSEKIDDFIDNDVTAKEVIVDYYLNFILYYGNLFSALLIFIAVILFTSKMAQQTEIIAIIAGGVSFNRLLRPYFISATILVVAALLLNHFLIPAANKGRINFERQYFWRPFSINDRNLHREVEKGTIVYFDSYNSSLNTAYKFSIEKWDGDTLSYKLLSDRANYHADSSVWSILNYYERINLPGGKQLVRKGLNKDTVLNVKPSDFNERVEIASTMSTPRLIKQIEIERQKGNDQVTFYEIELHQRTSYPIATYVLTLIGVSIASRKVRGGIGLHIAIGLVLVIVYIFFMKVCTVAATNAGIDPFTSVWIPNLIFAGIAAGLYSKAQK